MATVGDIIRTHANGTCSTELVKELSLQVIDEINLLIPNVLVSFDDLIDEVEILQKRLKDWGVFTKRRQN